MEAVEFQRQLFQDDRVATVHWNDALHFRTGRFPALVGAHAAYPSINPVAPANWRAFLEAASHPGAYLAPVLADGDRISTVQEQYLSQIWSGNMPATTALQQLAERVQAILDEANN